ncbi:cysteine hydrolase family protein [Leifsonia kafniensis]|uniref:Cysteine hydrolase family protein n=1 Tax=Leifsonia kafniensis TaxID=475957 RepID=A0ABP7KNJ4_9MICO
MTRALVIIDIQQDYFPGGANPLVGPEAAADAAARLLAHFRARGEPVIHIQHIWDAPDATFMRPGTPGFEIHPLVAPLPGESLVQKEAPNAFLGTDLEKQLRDAELSDLVVVGMMSSMCVDATVRAAADLGFGVTVAHDACAAPNLEFNGAALPGELVHASFMAALADGYAQVVSSRELIERS